MWHSRGSFTAFSFRPTLTFWGDAVNAHRFACKLTLKWNVFQYHKAAWHGSAATAGSAPTCRIYSLLLGCCRKLLFSFPLIPSQLQCCAHFLSLHWLHTPPLRRRQSPQTNDSFSLLIDAQASKHLRDLHQHLEIHCSQCRCCCLPQPRGLGFPHLWQLVDSDHPRR